jgi:hypothetical protein
MSGKISCDSDGSGYLLINVRFLSFVPISSSHNVIIQFEVCVSPLYPLDHCYGTSAGSTPVELLPRTFCAHLQPPPPLSS